MYKEISKLIMYGNLDNNSILSSMADIFNRFDNDLSSKEELITDIYTQIKRILEVATDYGFDNNLWQNYLTYFLITNENPFSITCEKVGANDGSVNIFAKNDFKVFYNLFHYDFSEIEEKLGIDCFSIISNYKAIVKKELMYNKNVSEKVRELSTKLARAKDENEFFDEVTEFYKAFGVGMFGLNKAFRISSDEKDGLVFHPINNMDKVVLDDLIGYEIQKKKLVENTENFVQGRKANNALLFGDSGTGKSTSIKAIVNQYYDQGLRMIEIYKHQFKDLSNVIASIKNRNYKFIIYMDDLSFEEFESISSLRRLLRAVLKQSLITYLYMLPLTEDILLRKHGMTEMIWRQRMVFTGQIQSKKRCHLLTGLAVRYATQSLLIRNIMILLSVLQERADLI